MENRKTRIFFIRVSPSLNTSYEIWYFVEYTSRCAACQVREFFTRTLSNMYNEDNHF